MHINRTCGQLANETTSMIDLLGQPIEQLPLTFFDVETTGLSPASGHRICELALLQMRGDQIEASYEQLINPQRPLDPGAFAVNQISTEMLRDAPVFAEISDQIIELVGTSVLVAHNAMFDVSFLNHELRRVDRVLQPLPVLDTLRLARRLLRRSSYSLDSLAYDLHLDLPVHRAMSDVRALVGLFRYLYYERLCVEDIHTLADVLRFQRGLLPGETEPTPPPLIAQAIREGRLLRIVYRSRSTPDPHERTIQPREVTQERKGLYLLAYCYLRDDERLFAIERIESMELVTE